MERHRPLISVCFVAGMLGGLVQAVLAWQIGNSDFPQWAGVLLKEEPTLEWFQARMFWGGLWGLVYFIFVAPTRARQHWVRKGLVVGLIPAAIKLFYTFPYQTPHGLAGQGLGTLTFAFILFYALAWGAATGFFCRLLWGRT